MTSTTDASLFERHCLTTGSPCEWNSWDGAKLPAMRWQGAGGAGSKGLLVCVHGLSGAAQDFGPLGSALSEQGWVTVACELRGQGNDPVVKRRGDLVAQRDWERDVAAFVAWAREQHPTLPWVLCGESMGAVLAVHTVASGWLREAAPRGVLLMAPVVSVDYQLAAWQELLFRYISRVLPRVRLALSWFTPREEEQLRVTRDEEYQDYLRCAPHRVESYTLRFVRNLGQLIESCSPELLRDAPPVLMLAAGKDCFIRAERVREFYEAIPCGEKEWVLFEEHFHCLLHDTEPEPVLECMMRWLERVVSGKARGQL